MVAVGPSALRAIPPLSPFLGGLPQSRAAASVWKRNSSGSFILLFVYQGEGLVETLSCFTAVSLVPLRHRQE